MHGSTLRKVRGEENNLAKECAGRGSSNRDSGEEQRYSSIAALRAKGARAAASKTLLTHGWRELKSKEKKGAGRC